MLQSDLSLRNFQDISSWIYNTSPPPLEFLPNLYGTPYHFKINCAEGNESSSFVSNNNIMSRFLLMISSKNSNLFFLELMVKYPTILNVLLSLLEEFSFLSFRLILVSLIPSFISQFLNILSFWKNYWFLARNCLSANLDLNNSIVDRPSKDTSFWYSSYQ